MDYKIVRLPDAYGNMGTYMSRRGDLVWFDEEADPDNDEYRAFLWQSSYHERRKSLPFGLMLEVQELGKASIELTIWKNYGTKNAKRLYWFIRSGIDDPEDCETLSWYFGNLVIHINKVCPIEVRWER